MQDCVFCKIVAGEIPAQKVFEDSDFIAILDINPVNLGHALLVPKNHERNILELSPELAPKIGGHVRDLAQAVKAATGADGINIGINNEPAAGQVVFHTHIHVIPRFESDGYEHWHGTPVTVDELKSIREKIRTNLQVQENSS